VGPHVQLFDRIVRLYQDMRKFMDDLREGMYIQQTVDALLADMEGKQLLIELTYAHGVLLLLLDQRMDPKVKEHIVVSFYRYRVRSLAG
jgi:WASH complex subunit strumpellin